MWDAVLSAAPGGAVVTRKSDRTSQIWRFIITGGAIAAVIGLAFRIGQMRYDVSFAPIHSVSSRESGGVSSVVPIQVINDAVGKSRGGAELDRYYHADSAVRDEPSSKARRRPSRRVGRLVPARETPTESSGWGIPSHPGRYRASAGKEVAPLASPMPSEADIGRRAADADDWATKRDAWNFAYNPPFVSTGGSDTDPEAEGVMPGMFVAGRIAEQSDDEQVDFLPGMAPPLGGSHSDVTPLPVDDLDPVVLRAIDRAFKDNMVFEQLWEPPSFEDSDSDGQLDTSVNDAREPVEEQEDLRRLERMERQISVRAPEPFAEDTEADSSIMAKPQPASRTQIRIIKTGKLTIEVDSYGEAAMQVESLALEHDAVVADTSAWEQDGGALTGWFEIRVSPDRFETLFASLKAIGRVEAENVKAADITANYVDLEARIATLRITEQRLAELITNKSFVDKMSALLEVEREMTRVRSEIELFTGRLRVMADQVALSTININLHEPARTVPSASLAVEVPVLDAAATAFGDVLEQVDGRLISGNTSKQSGGALKGTYEIRVSLARFGELLAAVEALGRVEERQVNDRQFGEAAAAWASDVQCHLSLVLFEPSRALPGGTVSIEVDGLDGALSKLGSALASSSGSIMFNRTTRQDDGSSTAVLRLRVPAGGFAELVDSLSALGRTTAKSVSGEAGSILGGAAAAPCDLSLTLSERPGEVPRGHIVLEVPEFEAAREKLSELVVEKEIQVLSSSSNQRTDGKWVGNFRLGIKSGQIESVLTRLRLLGRVASRHITGIGLGDLSRCSPDTLGVIDLTLGEKEALTPPPERMGGTLRNRLREGLAGFYASLGLIAYGLIVIAPWLIIVLLLAWVVMRIQRKRQASKGGVGGSS